VWQTKERRLVTYLLIFVCLFSFFIPVLRKSLVSLLKYPLRITDFFFNEFKALVFFHYNFLENIRLNKEIGLLKQKLSDYQELFQENQRLKALLSLRQNSTFRLIPAQVIMRSPETWSSLIVIDRGKKDGLKENSAVISYAGLVGRIVELGSSTAKVILLTDPGLCVSAIIQTSRVQGLVCGTLENYLVMRYLDEDKDIKIKDNVITAGLTEIFPKGILIGEITEIKKDPLDGRSYAKIKPAVDFNKLEEVMVILK
jgi:rod shape-determining protein MreC